MRFGRAIWVAAMLGVMTPAAMPTAAWALDPGTASGGYICKGFEDDPDDDKPELTVSHAIALRRDGPDQMAFDEDLTIRVVLTDRDVPLASILRSSFPPVEKMAVAGQVRGLMLEFNPADKSKVIVRVLDKPEPDEQLATVTLSGDEEMWKSLVVTDTRVTGELESEGFNTFHLRFSAPIFTNPITERVDGAAAVNHPLVLLAKAQTEALARGDLDTLAKTMSEKTMAEIRSYPFEGMEQVKAFAKEQLPLYAKPKSVVVRGDTATIMLDADTQQSFVRVDGVWKSD